MTNPGPPQGAREHGTGHRDCWLCDAEEYGSIAGGYMATGSHYAQEYATAAAHAAFKARPDLRGTE